MPEPTVKPFHASTIEELKKLAEEPLNKSLNKRPADRILQVIEKLHKEARKSLTLGDEEMAYVYSMRCMNCYTCLQENKDFKEMDQKYFKLKYGPCIKEAYDIMELLDSKLRKMYEQKKPALENSKIIEDKTEQLNNANNFPRNTNNKPPCSPQSNGVEQESSSEEKVYISSKELFEISVENVGPSISTLILDIRKKEDFEKSRMKLNDVINVPEEKILPGSTAMKLEQSLEECYKPYFKRRGEYDRVIIVDWLTTKKTAVPARKIYLMLTTLNRWDPRIKYKHPPLILDGGFEDWLSRYPTLTTNHIISPPKKSKNDQQFSLEEINYPTAFLEPEKVEKKLPTALENILKPTIDRSTKPGFQEKKTASTDKANENSGESLVKPCSSLDITENNNVTKIIIKNDFLEHKKDETNLKDKIDSFETDHDNETKNEYCRNGRRGALTSSANPPSSLTENRDTDTSDEDISEDRRNDGDNRNRFDTMKMVNNNQNENSSKLKRYSSTPNISKVGITDFNRPLVDRSTKPSNDDQLNCYTMGYTYFNEIGKGLTGLKNIGNTCYMNSILQCLSNTEPLRKKLFQWDIREFNENSKTRGAVAREVIYIIKQLWSGEGGPISCRSLKSIVGQHNDMFSGHEQQDSHEFLTILIDWLHEDLNDPLITRNLDGADENSGEKAWGEFISKNHSIIRQLFYGQLKSTVSCSMCKKQSVTFEPFSSLSLPLPPEKIDSCSLSECLKLYISSDEVDKWQCPDCKILRRATKKLDITKLPPLLVIHFKRFISVGGCKKQKTYVDFPEMLDMTSFIIGREHRNSRYQLYAVSNHSGTMDSGHYTAYCKNSANRKWYEFDDQNVSPMSSVKKTKEAYIVFYHSVSD